MPTLIPALFSLNMLLGTESGQAYSEPQLTDMVLAAVVTNIRRIPLNSPNDSGLLPDEKSTIPAYLFTIFSVFN